MKAYVYFAMVVAGLAGCAYGVAPEGATHDGGIVHLDAGTKKDAQTTTKDAGVQDSSVDLPDVQQQTQCSSLPLSTGLSSCDSCLGSSCCTEDQTCGFDQECMAVIGCLDNCLPTDGGPPDQQCETDCESQYPNGTSELSDLDTCMQNDCSTTCM